MDQRNHFPPLRLRGLLRRYGVSISVAVVLALMAAAGGSWGTAFGQSVPTISTPTPPPGPTVAPSPTPVPPTPTPHSGVIGSAPVVPNALPNTGEPPSGSGDAVLFFTAAGVALLGSGYLVRRRARQ